MGIHYKAYLFYGIIKKATDFSDEEISEWGFCECLEEFTQPLKGLGFVLLGYDEEEEAVVGESLGSAECGECGKATVLSDKRRKEVDALLGKKGSYLIIQGIS